jgi:hypothetical protein
MNPSPHGSFQARLFAPIDISSLVVFRVAFGGIMLWHILEYFALGFIPRYWIEPGFHFTYPGFHWVTPWPGIGMYVHMGILAALATCIAAGAFYRVSAALFCVGFTYTFLLEHATYLNHLYFVCLVSFLMIFVPAHRACSVDAWLRPSLRATIAPAWALWILRTQLAVVYIFAGLAKLNADWMQGEPLRSWLLDKKTTPIIGPLVERPETFLLISAGGLAFDLFIVPLLLWKRTRALAFAGAVLFHLFNAWFFNIGIFPWLSIAMTTLFFEPSWPWQIFRRWKKTSAFTTSGSEPALDSAPRRRRILTLLTIYVAFQVTIPLRHWLYPGDVAWTEEGHEFSWRMRLREKRGEIAFEVFHPTAMEGWFVDAEDHLAPWQASAMVKRPELIRQFAHYLGTINSEKLGDPVEVRVHSMVQLNNRAPRALVDPDIDLSREPYRIGPAPWITPAPPTHP